MFALPGEISYDPRYRALSGRRYEAAWRARASRSAYSVLTGVFVSSTAVAAIGGGLTLYGMEPRQDISAALHRWVADPTHRAPLLIVVALPLGAAAFARHRLRAASFAGNGPHFGQRPRSTGATASGMALRIVPERGQDAFREAGQEFEREARMPEFLAAVEAGDLEGVLGHAARVLEVIARDNSEFRQIRAASGL